MDIKQLKGFNYQYETHIESKVQLCNQEIQTENNLFK